MTTWEIFAFTVGIVVLPLLPAFLIYKYLPPETTIVKGPFHGLNLQLSGAFAAYFVVAIGLSLVSFKLIDDQRKDAATRREADANERLTEINALAYDAWDITGRITFADDTTQEALQERLRYVTILMQPPAPDPHWDGSFTIRDVPLKRVRSALADPILVFTMNGYQNETVSLARRSGAGSSYMASYDSISKVISFTPAVQLKPKSDLPFE